MFFLKRVLNMLRNALFFDVDFFFCPCMALGPAVSAGVTIKIGVGLFLVYINRAGNGPGWGDVITYQGVDYRSKVALAEAYGANPERFRVLLNKGFSIPDALERSALLVFRGEKYKNSRHNLHALSVQHLRHERFEVRCAGAHACFALMSICITAGTLPWLVIWMLIVLIIN
jgi:hypothetical protein